MPTKYHFVKVSADKYEDGCDFLYLRSDAANAYRKIYNRLKSRGGMLTSSGGLRSLNSGTGGNRSPTSLHYLGLALDLYIFSGMVDPKTDPYVISRKCARVYEVFARVSENNSEIERIENAITYDNRIKGVNVKGSFINLTQLFNNFGFEGIRAKPAFEKGGDRTGAEWWHFQYEKPLIAGQTTFGDELLKVYSKKDLENTAPWRYRDRVFKVDWF
jgi:hypothetical protein